MRAGDGRFKKNVLSKRRDPEIHLINIHSSGPKVEKQATEHILQGTSYSFNLGRKHVVTLRPVTVDSKHTSLVMQDTNRYCRIRVQGSDYYKQVDWS